MFPGWQAVCLGLPGLPGLPTGPLSHLSPNAFQLPAQNVYAQPGFLPFLSAAPVVAPAQPAALFAALTPSPRVAAAIDALAFAMGGKPALRARLDALLEFYNSPAVQARCRAAPQCSAAASQQTPLRPSPSSRGGVAAAPSPSGARTAHSPLRNRDSGLKDTRMPAHYGTPSGADKSHGPAPGDSERSQRRHGRSRSASRSRRHDAPSGRHSQRTCSHSRGPVERRPRSRSAGREARVRNERLRRGSRSRSPATARGRGRSAERRRSPLRSPAKPRGHSRSRSREHRHVAAGSEQVGDG